MCHALQWQQISIPIGYSAVLKESYDNMKKKIKEHNWIICGNIKAVWLLLGQQGGYTIVVQTEATIQNWAQWNEFFVGQHNILNSPLVEPQKFPLPPLHVKFGLMKQFVKALDQDGDCFKYLNVKFPAITTGKKKAGIFNGPQIRKLLLDHNFVTKMKKFDA